MLLLALAALSGVADASPARVTSLSGNGGYIDDSDFLYYPSEVSEVGNNVFLNYNGGMDGGASWEGKALYMSRDTLANDLLGLGPQSGWQLAYFNGSGSTGWSVRAGYDEAANNARRLGGTWSNGNFESGVKNLAVGGDVTVSNDLDSPDIGINGQIISRHVEAEKSTSFGAGVAFDTVSDAVDLAGSFAMGPRVENGPIIGSLTLGPSLGVTVSDGNFDMTLAIIMSNIAIEVPIKDWIVARGSAWAAPVTTFDGDNLGGFSLSGGGSAGVGIKAQYFDLDAAVQPGWLLNGPFFLSGAGSPMLSVLSLKVPL